jgi:hypothetical protein
MYPNLVNFEFGDKNVLCNPVIFCYCMGDYSPLKSSRFQNFVIKDVTSKSFNFLVKCILAQRFPRLKDFLDFDDIIQEIYYIHDILRELHILHYSNLFEELSKEIDYQLNID